MTNSLLKRDDPRLGYTTDELMEIIHRYEETEVKDFVKDGRQDSAIQMWVNLNMNLVTDEQIDGIRDAYIANGWEKVKVERHEERGAETLHICLYL